MSNTDEVVLPPEIEDRLRRGLVLLAEETPAPGAARRRRMNRLQTAVVGVAAALAAVLAGPALVDGLGSGGDSNMESSAEEPAAPVADSAGTATAAGDDLAAGPEAMTKSGQVPPQPAAAGADGDAFAEESANALDAAAPQMSAENYGRNADETGAGRVLAYDLRMLVEESQRIVVGKVSRVTQGAASDASGGLPYVLATLEVEDALRGPADARVVAFDYLYDENAVAAGAPKGASFAVGDRVLVFLRDPSGTAHGGLTPEHWQVTGGAQGRYAMNGAEPEAPFTLGGVRAEIERQARQ